MALDDVKMEILHSAEESAKAIKAEADAEIQKINAQTEAAISEMKEKEDRKLEETIERLGRQEISSAELESKKIVLAKKKEILAKAFDGALADLESVPAKTKLAQYKKMVASATKVIGKPKAYMSEDDSFTASDLGVSSVVKSDKISGGLVLESEDGTMQVDMQYKTILQTVWDREIKTLSEILFG